MQTIQSYFLHSRHTLAFSHLEQFSGSSGWYFVSLSYQETFSSLQSEEEWSGYFMPFSFFSLPYLPSSGEGQGLKWPLFFIILKASSCIFLSLQWLHLTFMGAAHQDRPHFEDLQPAAT